MAEMVLVNKDDLEAGLTLISDSIRSKTGKTEKLQFPDGMKEAIDVLKLQLQKRTGTVSITNNPTTVTCGFKPDAVFFAGTIPSSSGSSKGSAHAGVAFKEASVTSVKTYFAPPDTNYYCGIFTVNQTANGFTVSGVKTNVYGDEKNESGRSVNYIAIKYTE